MDNKFEIIKILLLLIIGACMGMIFVRSDQATVNITPKVNSEQQLKDAVEEEAVPETPAGETGEEESDDIIANINAEDNIDDTASSEETEDSGETEEETLPAETPAEDESAVETESGISEEPTQASSVSATRPVTPTQAAPVPTTAAALAPTTASVAAAQRPQIETAAVQSTSEVQLSDEPSSLSQTGTAMNISSTETEDSDFGNSGSAEGGASSTGVIYSAVNGDGKVSETGKGEASIGAVSEGVIIAPPKKAASESGNGGNGSSVVSEGYAIVGSSEESTSIVVKSNNNEDVSAASASAETETNSFRVVNSEGEDSWSESDSNE